MFSKKLKHHKETIGFAIALSLLLLFNTFLKFQLMVVSHEYEIYVGIIAVVFTLLGIWIAQKITKPKTKNVIVEKEIFINPALFVLNQAEADRRKISKREMEVLGLMALGLSNQEIANRLFVSLNTIKTHSSNLFEKLEVKRRTQAIETAKKLQLIP